MIPELNGGILHALNLTCLISDAWKDSEYSCEVNSSNEMPIVPPFEAPFYYQLVFSISKGLY